GTSTVYFRACDGAAARYQLDVAAGSSARFTDLSAGGSRVTVSNPSNAVARTGARWSLGPLALTIAPSGVVNAASFAQAIATGGLVSIFGSGFAREGTPTTVQISGQPARLLGVFPFQINAEIPAQTPAGAADLAVTSANGTDRVSIDVKDVAPGIFVIGTDQA